MAESPADPRATPEPRTEPASAPSVADALAAAVARLQPDANLAPTDDSPTVISRGAPRPLRTDDLLANSLRGKKLAHFELLEPIGVGGMAAVLRARDTQLDRIVALKILPPEMAGEEENVRRFHQEARAAAKLDHENIARVFFCGEDQGLHFIAFEFVEGENLRALMERRGRLPVAESVLYMLQIANGLSHAAARGVVHRDIKPSNIIIGSNGRAKLVDMGLARSQSQTDASLTQSGVTLGTFDYISPEQALEPREADVRSDIYSLGCTFYHALTGQPPVPDGTAAKKLHHHQQIAPIDPRQLNPQVPDDVAAVLSKMMAKNPRDRYQSGERLEQHLLLIAQKLGATADVPNPVLFVDAPLPSPPRLQLLLLVGVAAALVIGFVALFGQSTWTPPASGVHGAKDAPPRKFADAPPKNGDAVSPAVAGAQADKAANPERKPLHEIVEAATYAEIADAFRRHADGELDLALTADIDLNSEVANGETARALIFRGRKLTVRGKDPNRPPTLHFTYRVNPISGNSVWAALDIQAEETSLRDLRVVVDARASATRLAGVLLRGGRADIDNCEFVQAEPLYDFSAARLSGLWVTNGVGEAIKPTVKLTQCAFIGGQKEAKRVNSADGLDVVWTLAGIEQGGQNAVTVGDGVRLEAENCVFGPHQAVFHMQGRDRDVEVSLHNCSVLLGNRSAAFQLDQKGRCRLEVEACLFSRPGPAGTDSDEGHEATLVRQISEGSGRLDFVGADNRYHNLDSYWSRPAPAATLTDLAAFRADVVRDDRSHVLTVNPWANDPFKFLAQLERDEIRDAFLVKRDLRDARQDGDALRLVGAEKLWDRSYPVGVPNQDSKTETVAARNPRERIVDPGNVTESGNGRYPTIGQALGDAKPGDVILLHWNGQINVEPVELKRAADDVTIRPAPGMHPVLTLGDTPDHDAAMFRLHDGKLTLEGLEFLLQPTRADYHSQSVVTVLGDGQCIFRDCLATFVKSDEVALSLLALGDPSSVMKMDMGTPRSSSSPRVQLKNCFVRGDGDLVAVRPSRTFNLDAANVLAALNGSFFTIEGPRGDATMATQSQVQLDNVTTYLTEPVVRLRTGKDLKGLIPLRIQPTRCLFVSAVGKSVIHLDGEANEQQLAALLTFESHNCRYNNFMQFLDQQPKDDMMPPPAFMQEKWKRFTGDSDSQFDRRKIFELPSADFPLSRVSPSTFRNSEAGGLGADPEQLPKPAQEGISRTPPDDQD
jgi:predicted Ser/Thr protein kinase